MQNLKNTLRNIREVYRIKKKAKEAGSEIFRPLKISKSQYVKFGKDVRIKENARIECYDKFANVNLKPELVIEDGVIIGYNFSCLVANRITIKKDTILASHILVSSENHGMNPLNELPYYRQPLLTAPVTIGSGCWIGENVVILAGVEIGDKCIIAAGSIVTKSVPDHCIAAGVPAKVIKKFNFETCKWDKV